MAQCEANGERAFAQWMGVVVVAALHKQASASRRVQSEEKLALRLVLQARLGRRAWARRPPLNSVRVHDGAVPIRPGLHTCCCSRRSPTMATDSRSLLSRYGMTMEGKDGKVTG